MAKSREKQLFFEIKIDLQLRFDIKKVVLPNFLLGIRKTTNSKFWTRFAKNFHNFSKKVDKK
jgi:hypothetical protein